MSSRLGFSAWPAPAKLNLFLHVTGRRADGYHQLQTLFRLVDWGDRLHLRVRDDDRIRRTTPLPDIAEASDLSLRAARALQAASGCRLGADIAIDKRLPFGAGLGGGSSDAATTLVALNLLWKLGLSVDRLAAIGLQLGADVPVFVRGHNAWAEGVGEILQPVALPSSWYVIACPECSVNTGTVFNDASLRRDHPVVDFADFKAGRCTNVCEPVTRRLFPPVEETFRQFQGLGAAPRLSGTGASVFAEFSTFEAAETLRSRWSGPGLCMVTPGLAHSPLLDLVQ
ncbi:4-(cytidine 5'-diphospho)-2-C-methyl-D-erythritol kinase [Algiphilus sp. W345]|uniref:4-diphosphocytidyl-2-C-methyl-D-erythritol kinase n=1 Tax=Banduia mediterranea TaxID=3075609 RepID=A0ABU2WIQ9_9GAMM|nr:4-(cytidine 5'-diphospho)-2-C-methyl-D-erythritol kinase [Algiphilus sp. W345]MDT0496977.1 4-(cytidine 5'-diphospho)-2-C-methyl-D-erythritol kinase [Algiphilus sp. W345]